MLQRRLSRDRVPAAAALLGLVIGAVYLAQALLHDGGVSRAQRLLTLEPWYCEVHDPDGRPLVSRSVETFHEGGTLDGRARLEDPEAGRLLLEFSYRGVWQFEDPWLTEAISEYRYHHVNEDAFSRAELAAIEAEFAEPEISRVHALTEGQLVYGAHRSLYQCYRRTPDDLGRSPEDVGHSPEDVGRSPGEVLPSLAALGP